MGDDGRPDWWARNEAYKRRLGIPEYSPPRFQDGEYTYAVVDDLEEAYGCTVRFVGRDSRYPEDWEVRVDGTPVMAIGRHRDENGNTVYEMDSSEFKERLVGSLSDSGEPTVE